MEAQPIDLGENTPGKGHALRDGIFGALKGIGLAVVVLAVIGGVLNIFLLTSTGQELVDHLRPPAVGRYRYVYGGLGSLFATLGPFIALVGSLSAIRRGRTGLAARAGEGMPVRAKLVVAALVLAAGCWGIWLYRVHQLRADDDHDYQAAREVADRLHADAEKLGEAFGLAEAAVDFPRMLDEKSLVSRSEIDDGRRRLETFYQAVKRFEADVTALRERGRADIGVLAIAEDHNRMALAAFDERTATDRSQVKALAAVELEMVVAAREILSFVEARSGTIRVDRGALQLKSSADVREYQRLRGRFQSAVERQEKILKEIVHPT